MSTGNLITEFIRTTGYNDSNYLTRLEYMMSEEKKQQPEWITTRDAKTILKVTSTQGVWNVIERAKRYHEFELRKRNIGTEDMPRYLLNRQDVETVAELMGKVDD